jgi:hypothetical protein
MLRDVALDERELEVRQDAHHDVAHLVAQMAVGLSDQREHGRH